MPAAIVARLWNTGRRAAAFLALLPSLLTAQPDPGVHVASGQETARLQLQPAGMLSSSIHRLEWNVHGTAVPKISVSAPVASGVWLRVSPASDGTPPWWYVPLGSGRSPDLRPGRWTSHGRVHIQYDWTGFMSRPAPLPVVFTFTEG